MRPPWIVGYCAAAGADGAVSPEGVGRVLGGDRSVWADHRVRRVDAAGLHLVVSGLCAAPTSMLAQLLAAIAAGRAGIEALTGLGGSYHVVLDDGRALTVAGDVAGLRPVFTASVAGIHLFASTPLGLAGLVDRGLDTDFLAGRLTCPDAQELFEGSSAFAGIRQVPPGAFLRCAPEGVSVIGRAPVYPQPGYDGAALLRERLTAAVGARLHGSVSADLSGGLDSTSLALIAAQQGAKDLLAVTFIDPLACGDEDVTFARRAGGSLGGGEHAFVEGGRDSLPYTGIDEFDPMVFDEPAQELLLARRAQERLAPGRGRDVHLGGDGGDVVLAGPLNFLVDLARRRRYRTLVREAAGLARLRQRPAHTVIRAALRAAGGSYSGELLGCASELERVACGVARGWHRPGVEANLAWCRLSAAAAWSTPAAAARVAERLRALAPAVPDLDADALALRAVVRHGGLTRQARRLASTWGIDLHAPFLDDPVVAACTRVPVIERTTMARAKPLLGQALAGLVPDEVLQRRSKGDYSASEYAGLAAAGPRLLELMTEPHLADLGLIEPARIRPVLEAAIAGAPSPMAGLGEVIATEFWLRAEPAHAAYPWKKE